MHSETWNALYQKIVSEYKDQLISKEFDVRQKNELPDDSFDLFISSGGPGAHWKVEHRKTTSLN